GCFTGCFGARLALALALFPAATTAPAPALFRRTFLGRLLPLLGGSCSLGFLGRWSCFAAPAPSATSRGLLRFGGLGRLLFLFFGRRRGVCHNGFGGRLTFLSKRNPSPPTARRSLFFFGDHFRRGRFLPTRVPGGRLGLRFGVTRGRATFRLRFRWEAEIFKEC